jgi:ABC-type bacteriocin/lantibiotic exporter with double-glycine peptidase domain
MRNFIKIYTILGKNEKLYFFYLVLISFVTSILDLISIGSIYPLVISTLNIETSSTFFKKINIFIKEDLNINLTNFYITIIFLAFIFKNLFNIFFSVLLNYFLMKKFNNNAKYLIEDYLNLEFINFISKSFPEFHANIINVNNNFRFYILNLLTLISEFLVFFSIIFIMIVIDYKVTLSLFLLFVLFILIYGVLFKKKIKLWGHTKHSIYQDINKNLLIIYNSIKDIKIFEKEKFFTNNFFCLNSKYSFIEFKFETLMSINRNIIELVILVLASTIFIYSGLNNNIYNLIPLISMYIIAFFRIYPSVNKIINNLTTIKFYGNSLDYFYNQKTKLKLTKDDNIQISKKINFLHKIELKNIYFRYDKSENFLLENVNIVIKKGEIIGIVGSNGSGKSTLCNLILGLIKPERGSIIIDDKINIHDNYQGYKKILSFVPQKVYLANDTIKNNIAFGSHDINQNHFDTTKIKNFSKLLFFNLKNYHNNILEYNIGEDGSKLSGGEKQRVAIARALYRDSEILIMDEPDNNLDIEIEKEIIDDLISLSANKTIIIITHNPKTLKYCSRIIEVKDKQVDFIK